MKIRKQSKTTKLALCAGAAALAALAPQAHAQSSDALIDKLVDKGILSVDEAKDLRDETDKDFKTAFQAKTGMPDWVTGLKISGDFRGRYDQINQTDSSNNPHNIDRTRFRYRLRFGIVANIVDNMEVGFRLASGDQVGTTGQANPLSANSTMQNDGSKKGIYIDTAYAKWTAINNGDWLLAATIGKMDNPFAFTPMVFDPDYTPEGGAITGSYTFQNDTDRQQTIAFTGAAFALDEEGSVGGANTTQDPYMVGGQVILNSKWTQKLSSSVGVGYLFLGNGTQLTTANVPYINQGNTRVTKVIDGGTSGVLVNDYNPFIADASVTYMLDSFPFYNGAFPIKPAAEFIHNPGAENNNEGFWVGATLGKSGTKRTWDLTYRYEYLEADAWYDQVVDDDPVAYYQNAPVSGSAGALSGTNIKGHMVKLNYSITDYLTLSLTGYVTSLINDNLHVPGSPNVTREPNSTTIHMMADLMWKF